jgi:large subunit ribosomal protein L17
MRHRKHGRKLGRTTAHRQAMVRNLVCSLFLTAEADDKPWRVKTTVPKAKEARRLAERCVTLGKRAESDPDRALHCRRRAIALLQDKDAIRILFETIAPLYNDRQGGYTRILRLDSRRLGDGADLCLFELVREPVEVAAPTEPVAPRRKRPDGADAAAPSGAPAPPEEETAAEEDGDGEPEQQRADAQAAEQPEQESPS